jgi:biopolymer transport protein ExbD
MRFFARKRKQAPTVIIVALIDVLIVLVIFLMVTTTFKQQQPPSLKMVLPESSQAQKSGADAQAPLIVSIDAKGDLRFGADEIPVTDERLKSELASRAEKDPQLKVAISADEKAPFGQIIKVMDAAKEAHLKTVSAYTRETAKP